MRALLSTIGSRGDVQPLVALGLELRALDHEARICAPPNFAPWVESFGLPFVPIGPDVRARAADRAVVPFVKMTEEQRQQLADESVREQFRVVGAAATGCDVVLAAGGLQLAARSVCESAGIPYVFVGYSPSILPSDDHPPPRMDVHHLLDLPAEENRALWRDDARRMNDRFRRVLNEERARLGLPATASVRRYMFTGRPWIAADSSLAPLPRLRGIRARQPGALLLRDSSPLPDDIARFLDAGAPPIFFGFGSMRGAPELGRLFVDAARAVGRRAIVHRGWAGLPSGGAADCLTIGEVAYDALFPRVAAVVHHGGAGTTTAAALAGRPQVLVPHLYDQFWMAHRIGTLGVGTSVPLTALSRSALVEALRAAVTPDVASRANALGSRIDTGGARRAAGWLLAERGGRR